MTSLQSTMDSDMMESPTHLALACIRRRKLILTTSYHLRLLPRLMVVQNVDVDYRGPHHLTPIIKLAGRSSLRMTAPASIASLLVLLINKRYPEPRTYLLYWLLISISDHLPEMLGSPPPSQEVWPLELSSAFSARTYTWTEHKITSQGFWFK